MARFVPRGFLAALVLCVACQGAPPEGVDSAPMILDQARNGGAAGFHFLPPLAPRVAYRGTFQPGLAPTVQIDLLATVPIPVAVLTRESGAVQEVDEAYVATWNTGRSAAGGLYRIRVLAPGAELGHADVRLATSKDELRKAPGDVPTFLAGRSLPVKFRIEQRVLLRASVGPGGAQGDLDSLAPSLSADGRLVAFESWASTLVRGDANQAADVFVHDLHLRRTERVSVSSAGEEGDGSSRLPSLSAGGRFVAFESWATNLVSGDSNGFTDVFVHDRLLGTTERVSVGPGGVEADGPSTSASISGDGRYVAFASAADNLVPGDANLHWDVFVRDRLAGASDLVSVDSAGWQGNGNSLDPRISGDGRYVTFSSRAPSFEPDEVDGDEDVYVFDRVTRQLRMASADVDGVAGNADSAHPAISGDGRAVAFFSAATNLGRAHEGGWVDVFVKDLETGEIRCESRGSSGAQAGAGSGWEALSPEGRWLTFSTTAANLEAGDANGTYDVYVHDRVTGATFCASERDDGAHGNRPSWAGSLAAGGKAVAFASAATDLVPPDGNEVTDVLVRLVW